jgi:hypothetical protein
MAVAIPYIRSGMKCESDVDNSQPAEVQQRFKGRVRFSRPSTLSAACNDQLTVSVGSSMQALVPLSESLVTERVPPRASTRSLIPVNPEPRA